LEDGTVYSTSENLIFTDIDNIPDEGFTLTLVGTDPVNLCDFSKDIHIIKFEVETITPDDIIVADLSDNNTISVSPQNIDLNTYEFALDNAFGETGTFQNEPYFENVSPGIRTLFYRDINDCGSGQIDISIIGFPNFFTPNNDGVNDTWNVLGVNEAFFASSKVNIFDRFGKLIIQIDLTSDGWNGRLNGNYLPSTDYWFTVELVDLNGIPRFKKGHFSLIRK
jgi:gliding motility-associated-like protein